jgi:hypothetical protein
LKGVSAGVFVNTASGRYVWYFEGARRLSSRPHARAFRLLMACGIHE